jgi:hypothetical protein
MLQTFILLLKFSKAARLPPTSVAVAQYPTVQPIFG